MATNLALSDELIRAAQEAGGHKTKRQAVTAALQEYVQRRAQLKLLDVFGTVEFEPGYDHKKSRQRR